MIRIHASKSRPPVREVRPAPPTCLHAAIRRSVLASTGAVCMDCGAAVPAPAWLKATIEARSEARYL